jgi:hypothetical protein
MAKGVKGDFDAVVGWLGELTNHIEHIIRILMELNSTESIYKFLQIFRAGMISRSSLVCSASCKFLSYLSYELLDNGLSEVAWAWFSDKNYGGIHVSLLATKRHIDCVDEIINTVLDYTGSVHLEELLIELFPQTVSDPLEYLQFLSKIYHSLTAHEEILMVLETSQIVNSLTNLALNCLASEEVADVLKTDCINFLTVVWTRTPQIFEKIPTNVEFTLNFMTKFIRSSQMTIQKNIIKS